MSGGSRKMDYEELFELNQELLSALKYVRRFLNKDNINLQYVDKIIAEAERSFKP